MDAPTDVIAVQRTPAGDLRLDSATVAAGPDDVWVRVAWAAVNPFDLQVLQGEFGTVNESRTLGAVASGWVDDQPVLVTGQGLGVSRDGTWAEGVAAPPDAVHDLPPDIDLRAVATVGIAGRTAWRAVHELAAVAADDTVLVLGATGAVGDHAVQLAGRTGAEVIGQTSSSAREEPLQGLGIQPVVAGDPETLRDQVADRHVDVVLDPLGGAWSATLLSVLAPGARVVMYGTLVGAMAHVDLRILYGGGISLLGMSGATATSEARHDALVGSLQSVMDGHVRVSTHVLSLNEADRVLEVRASRSVVGTLLLEAAGTGGRV